MLGFTPKKRVELIAARDFHPQDFNSRHAPGAAIGPVGILRSERHGNFLPHDVIVVLIDAVGVEARDKDVPVVRRTQRHVANLDRALIGAGNDDAVVRVRRDRAGVFRAGRTDLLRPGPFARDQLREEHIAVAGGDQRIRSEGHGEREVARDIDTAQRIHRD